MLRASGLHGAPRWAGGARFGGGTVWEPRASTTGLGSPSMGQEGRRASWCGGFSHRCPKTRSWRSHERGWDVGMGVG